MTWHFNDGTVAHLGGKIEGGTAFAQELRLLIADEPIVQTQPIPNQGTPLDANDPALFDRFLRDEMARPCNEWMMLRLVKAPEVPALPEEEPQEEYAGTLLY